MNGITVDQFVQFLLISAFMAIVGSVILCLLHIEMRNWRDACQEEHDRQRQRRIQEARDRRNAP